MAATPSSAASPAQTPPPNYWDEKTLKLFYTSATQYSLDTLGAVKYKKTATAPHDFVTRLQDDLIALGYLSGSADGAFGAKTQRSVLRFQRHAARLYRMTKAGVAADLSAVTYNGRADGTCDYSTAQEIRNWINKTWVIPLGRFSLVAVSGGKLRQDVATAWNSVAATIKSKGGTIDGPYGDTTRNISFRKSTGGNSLYSFHYTGRAIDLNQSLAGGKGQRYYVVKEVLGGHTFWRIYCKTDKQNGTQGTKILKSKKIKYYSFYNKTEYDLPEAHYLDITEILKNANFTRIKAHSNWQTNAKGMEWWHFHYDKDIQTTFQDEMELIGHSEAALRKNGWDTDAKLDKTPG